MKRVFAAFPIIGETSKVFLEISERNKLMDGIRWTKKDNLHITLFFIGEVEEENSDKIIPRLENVAKKFKPFNLQFEKIELRRTKQKPSMIWGRFEKCIEFSELSNAIRESAADFMTIDVTHKDPIPHCTLARIKPNTGVEKLDLLISSQPDLTIDRLELWMTVQEQDGVRYERLVGYSLC